jgi:hypothetical protein
VDGIVRRTTGLSSSDDLFAEATMNFNKFIKATRQKVFLKLAFTGPTGSVKTYSANLLAAGLANGGRIALLDTENQSASLYANRFRFDVLDISPPFTESKFIDGIRSAVQEGYCVLIIDSFSHAWQGVLDYKAGLDAKGGNSYVNWNKAGSKFNDVLAAVLQSKIHIIACMRSKMDYILEPDTKGRMTPRRVGLAPIMRDGTEYEFTTVFDGDLDHFVTVSKDRTGLFIDQRFRVTEETGSKLLAWLESAPEIPAPVGSVQPAELSVQEQFVAALADIDPKQLIMFLLDRGQIRDDQEITDVSAEYARQALSRIAEFRKVVNDFDFLP